MKLRDRILSYMETDAYKPMNFEELKSALNLKKPNQVKRFKKVLKKMTQQGQIVKNRYGYYGLPAKMNLLSGTIQGHPKGFAFLLPDKPGLPDIFISPRNLNGALHRDTVMIRVHKEEKLGQKPEGEVVRILSRGTQEIVGVYDKNSRYGFVVPDDDRFHRDIFVSQDDDKGAENGEKVVVRIIKWPDKPSKSPEGEITRVLGHPEAPGVDIDSIMSRYGLTQNYPEAVNQQLNSMPEEISTREYQGREMLQDTVTVTIDGSDAKDLDDAISLEALENGNFLLGVHIADVSHYVREGTPLDQEAKERGTSVYLVDRVIPMLPPKLSNNLCSLNPEVERLAVSALLELTPEGTLENYNFTPSVIKSNHRLTYEEVNALYQGDDQTRKEKLGDVTWMLFTMKELSEKLRAERFKGGSIDFDFDEPEVILDNTGTPIDIKSRGRGPAEKLIEEFMLLANRVVAKHHYTLEIPFIYRVHEEPDEDKMATFKEFASKFGYNLPKGSKNNGVHPRALQELLERVKGEREEKAISTMMLRSMKQARYSVESLGHFGLSFPYYTHFTSPIRRYPDLIVHRILKESLDKEQLRKSRRKKLESKLGDIAYHASLREQEATEAERESVDYKMAEYMEQYLGTEFDGQVSSVTSFGLFIELQNLVEGLIHVSSLVDDYYLFDEKNYALIGENSRRTFRIGDRVRIRVSRVSKLEQQIDFELLEKYD